MVLDALTSYPIHEDYHRLGSNCDSPVQLYDDLVYRAHRGLLPLQLRHLITPHLRDLIDIRLIIIAALRNLHRIYRSTRSRLSSCA
jgi:hypothetical protein